MKHAFETYHQWATSPKTTRPGGAYLQQMCVCDVCVCPLNRARHHWCAIARTPFLISRIKIIDCLSGA